MNSNDRISFSIRDAGDGDERLIVALLAELAAYEKEPPPTLTQAQVARDMLQPSRLCTCHLIYADNVCAGLGVWFAAYRSFTGLRGVYVEDLYVRPEFRGHGAGRLLLAHMARIAQAQGGFLEWKALDWNKPARAFYEGLGAVAIPQWLGYRLSGDALERLAS